MTDSADLAQLARPFTPAAVRFKVQATFPKDAPRNGIIVTYVDVRSVRARLDYVCGWGWSDKRIPLSDNAMLCELTVRGVTRSGVGTAGSFEKEKAADSDSLKRAAVAFGVGAYLYAMKAVTLAATESGELDSNGRATLILKGQKKRPELHPGAVAYLRQQYARWLESDANVWGDPLDHNEVEEAVGDPAELEAPGEEADPGLASAKAIARSTFGRLWDENSDGFRRKNPKGQFNAKLLQADSVAKVDALVEGFGEPSPKGEGA